MSLENARMPGTTGASNIPRKPYDGKRRLCNVVDVRFEHILQFETFDCRDLIVRNGDTLVVQTARGPQLATARGVPRRELVDKSQNPRVLRIASTQDEERAAALREESRRAMRFTLSRIRAHRLHMKLVSVEYMLDRSRALVYFTSEKRVDFRGLVRDLARELRIRIEMRQIGVREGAGLIGGIGPCGHELCCSSFLRSFKNVSIRAPKLQGITLNPQRITGMCGRLKCCLLYETPAYQAAKSFVPRRNASVLTAQGPATIISANVLSRTLLVRFAGGSSEAVHLRDVVVLDHRLSRQELQATMTREEEVLARRRQRSSGGHISGVSFEQSADDYLWDDLERPLTFFGTDTSTKREVPKAKASPKNSIADAHPKRRKRRRKGKEAGASARGDQAKNASSKKKKRRRRSTKRRGSAAKRGEDAQGPRKTAKTKAAGDAQKGAKKSSPQKSQGADSPTSSGGE